MKSVSKNENETNWIRVIYAKHACVVGMKDFHGEMIVIGFIKSSYWNLAAMLI